MRQWGRSLVMMVGLGIMVETPSMGAFAQTSLLGSFMASAGKVEITPTRSVYLAGYASNRKNTGVHDPLWARCLVMRNGSQTVALISCDVIGISRYHGQKIRALVKSVPGPNVLIGATHTHSGPDTYGQWGPNFQTSGVDKEWISDLYHKVAALVDNTAAKLQPARVKFANRDGLEKISYNARVRQILDTELGAMQIVDKNGQTIATLVNYACHPEILNNHQMTSDFPHWLRQRVEEKLGGIAIYMNGAQGGMVTADIQNEKSFPKGEAWPEAERIGLALADKTVEILVKAETVPNPPLVFQHREFQVPLQNERFKALISLRILPGEFAENGLLTTEVNRLKVGDAEFLTLPGEVLPNIGFFLKRHMKGHPRFLLGLTCDALGYILTPEDYGLQLYSYETSVCVGPEMGKRMEENLLALLSGEKQEEKKRAVAKGELKRLPQEGR